ncbi:hypothetical protein HN865_02350 [Candidatus Woesearchaeota archaeon]|jgi:RNA polymerase sigma factor (sigma-70 family)|nr:hypothetical protein [Candidatus Woesearchaeota archaeon]MBT7237675.1 hypothetical protein [Candidatus Woesearchaeota archaeon]
MVNFPKHVSIERERELVDLIKEGSIEARNELVEVNLRYFRVINHKFGEAIGLTKEETEDIFQTFIVEYALRATKKYIPQREETRFVHYLGRYAYRNMLEIAKRDIPGFKGHVKYHPSIPFSTKKDLEDIHSTEEVNEEVFYQIPISETISYTNQKNPEEILMNKELKKTLEDEMENKLTAPQIAAVCNNVGNNMTLDTIGEILSRTREAIRQSRERGLRKLKTRKLKKHL